MLATVAPANACDRVISWQLAQFFNLRRASAPYIHRSIQPHCKYIASAPVYQIKVEIVLQIWSIENLIWHLVDFAGFSAFTEIDLFFK